MEKPHIGIYGACNSGKSTLLNRIAEREIAIVSPVAGTTTDPVKLNFEILDFAPVVAIDTAGIDDDGRLGGLRTAKSYETLEWVDLALVVFTQNGWDAHYETLMAHIRKLALPYLLVYNDFDGTEQPDAALLQRLEERYGTCALPFPRPGGTDEILEAVKRTLPAYSYTSVRLFEGMVDAGDPVLLICPIDGEAPSGRLILPQVQAIRALLDAGAIVSVVQPEQIPAFLAGGVAPKLAVTDSQVIDRVRKLIPPSVPLTTFSIELARVKGDMEAYREGLAKLDRLQDGDRILILESCSHQTNCEDIGRVKIPRWLREYTGKRLEFTLVSGLSPLPENLGDYAWAIQCGGCMVSRRQLFMRLRRLKEAGIPVVNYGMLIARIR